MSVLSVPVAAAPDEEVAIPALRSVLVATDFSRAGNRAVPYAFTLLHGGGTVHLVTVGSDPRQAEELERRLRRLLPKDAEAQGRKVQVEVLSGQDVAATLLKAAERMDVDALCLGTHGHSGFKKLVLGSVAQEVLSRADRPVLLVCPPER